MHALSSLAAEEIIPILGSLGDQSFLPSLLERQKTFDAIVSTTEQLPNYESHFKAAISLLQSLADASNAAGVRPIILFTSGCKDYGMTDLADSPTVAEHTESSALNPPNFLRPRTINATKVFEHSDSYDSVVLRPTKVYGRSGSFYSLFFQLATQAKERNEPLKFPAHAKTVLHGTHIDDCADAYVPIAECKERKPVACQCCNISGWRYETLEEIAEALVKEYGLEKGAVYDPPQGDSLVAFDPVILLTGFSQWVGSEKLRMELGWKDRSLLFSENSGAYRIACEEASRQSNSSEKKIGYYMLVARIYKGVCK